MLKSPGAVAFNIGGITIYIYGIIVALAFFCGIGASYFIAKRDFPNDNSAENLLDAAPLLLFFGILFARLYYVLFSWEYYSQNIPEILMVWNGGLSIHGALLGGILALYAFTKYKKESLLKYCDLCAYGTILAQSIGRWGNFFNSEAFGKPTELIWKMYIPPESRPLQYLNYEYFHPVFLYESLWNFLVFIILVTFIRRTLGHIQGAVSCFYIIFYSCGRFVVENLRLDNIFSVFGMHIASFTSILGIIIASMLLFVLCTNKRQTQNHKKCV